jgi:hypothetical protein
MNEFDGPPKNWPPLGMPTGSVRAILTLIVVAVVITRMVQGADIGKPEEIGKPENSDLLWVEALLIALSHYFTSRRFVELPPNVLKDLEDQGIVERERHPLFLPRNSIRIIIVGAFGWLAYYLYTTGHLFQHHAASLLGMLAAFALGAIVRRIGTALHFRRAGKSQGTWGDLKALIVLVVLLIIAVPEFLGSPTTLHPILQKVGLGMMLFYFGSR